jgi:hypothetical protein
MAFRCVVRISDEGGCVASPTPFRSGCGWQRPAVAHITRAWQQGRMGNTTVSVSGRRHEVCHIGRRSLALLRQSATIASALPGLISAPIQRRSISQAMRPQVAVPANGSTMDSSGSASWWILSAPHHHRLAPHGCSDLSRLERTTDGTMVHPRRTPSRTIESVCDWR